MNFKTIISSIWTKTKKASPDILVGLGIAGMVVSTVLAVKQTPKAYDILRNKLYEEHDVEGYSDHMVEMHAKEMYTTKEIIASCWRVYSPVIISTTLSAACFIFADVLHNRRNSALVAAYELADRTFQRYTAKVIDNIGVDKEREIRQQITKDEVERHPINEQTISRMASGDTYCFDTLTGRYFYSDPDVIRRIENKLNLALREELTYTLNELYSDYGLDSVKLGDMLGWDIEDGYLTIIFDTQLTQDDKPCLALSYSRLPRMVY